MHAATSQSLDFSELSVDVGVVDGLVSSQLSGRVLNLLASGVVSVDLRERSVEVIGIISSGNLKAVGRRGPKLIGLPRCVPSIVIDEVLVVVLEDCGVVGRSSWQRSLSFNYLSVV